MVKCYGSYCLPFLPVITLKPGTFFHIMVVATKSENVTRAKEREENGISGGARWKDVGLARVNG